jgi:hypothetical protein
MSKKKQGQTTSKPKSRPIDKMSEEAFDAILQEHQRDQNDPKSEVAKNLAAKAKKEAKKPNKIVLIKPQRLKKGKSYRQLEIDGTKKKLKKRPSKISPRPQKLVK